MSNLPPGLQPIIAANNGGELKDIPLEDESKLTDMDKFGLNGLSGLIKMELNDQTTVAIGNDINLLKVDLSKESENEKLSKTFASPWEETSRTEVEPSFQIPQGFQNIKNVISIEFEDRIKLFTDETLFFIFYTKPRDLYQEIAARELNARNWRYHKEIQVWLTKDSEVEPVSLSPTSERGVYVFFDPHNWEKIRKEFVLNYHAVM